MDEVMMFENFSTMACTEETMGPKRDSFTIIIPIIIVYVLIFVTGTVGNVSTCIVIARNKSMHTATNFYLFSLAVSDLLLLLSGLPQEVYLIYSRYPYVFGSAFCFLRGLFAEMSANATVLTITAFTVERYLAICHPFLSHTMSKLSRVVKLILGIWMVAACLAVPQAMQFQIVGPKQCEMCQFAKPIIKHSFEVSTLLFFIMPMTLITVLYVLIGLKLKSSSMIKGRNTNLKIHMNSSKKVVKMLVAVVVAFFICWAPFHAQRLYVMYSTHLSQYDKEMQSFYLKIYDIVTYVSGILYYMSATVNPILYNIMSVKFREAFKETFTRCCPLGDLKNGGPQRSYSVLSRSVQRGPTDSFRDDPMHTSVTQRSSIDYNNGIHTNAQRPKSPPCSSPLEVNERNVDNMEILNAHQTDNSSCQEQNPPKQNPTYINIKLNPLPPKKFGRFLQLFHCLAKRTFDENNKRVSVQYTTSNKDTNPLNIKQMDNSAHIDPCSRPLSTLNDETETCVNNYPENFQNMDELTTYMNEIRNREYI